MDNFDKITIKKDTFINFILWHCVGSGGAPVTSGKVTPIPLGPSSVSPVKVQPPKSRRPSLSTPVNNAVSENDDDYYLQRSDSSDSKLQHDLLRGSSSGNFFSNRNRGLENPDDYDDTAARVTSFKDEPKKNAKAPFRKLLTGKKPVAAESPSTTTAAVSSTTETVQQRSAGTTTVRQPNYKPTTYRSKDRGRVNYKTYLDKQAKADEYDHQKVLKPSTQTATTTFSATSNSYQPTTAKTNSVAYQTTTQVNNAQVFTSVNSNQPINNDFLRIAPINQNNHNSGFQSNRVNSVPANNNNGFQSNRINSVPAGNGFQVNNPFPAVNNVQTNNAFLANNNNFQASNAFPPNNNDFQINNAVPNTINNNFQSNNAFPVNNNNNNNHANDAFQQFNNNFQQNANLNQGGNFQSEKLFTTTTQNYNQANVVRTNAYQQQQQRFSNTFQPNAQFQNGQTTQVYGTYQSPTAFQQSTNVIQSSTPYNAVGGNFFQKQQQTSQQPQFQSTTEHFSKDNKAKFDPYSSYLHQRTNEEPDELLKTAPSTNLRPSDLNALVQQAKPKSINATLSVGYSFNKADGGVAKSTVIVPAPTTQKPRPFTTQSAAAAVTTSSSSSSTTAFAASSSTKTPITSKDKDSSYDYAYYDDSNHNDYTDVVPEDFSRINGAKKF